jgi:hypothetical protein
MADDQDTTPDDTVGGEPEPKPEASLTQAQFDKALQKRLADQAKAKDKEWGELLASAKSEADRAAMSEAEKLQAEAREAKEAADRLAAEVKAERLSFRFEQAMTQAGFTGNVSRIRHTLEADADTDDIAAEVEAIKNESPALFGGNATNQARPAPKAVKAPAATGGMTALDKGAAAYQAQHSKTA